MSTLTHLASTGVDNAGITDQILVAALIASLQDQKQTFSQKELLASDFSPTDELSLRAIDQLIKAGLVQTQEKCRDPQTTYELKIPNNEHTLKNLISSIKGVSDNDEGQLNKLILEVLSAECIEYVITEMGRRSLSIKSDLKPPERLYKLLSGHTCSEVHMLLWQAIQNLSDSDFRILIATESHSTIIGQVVDEAYQYHERYQQFNRSIKSFNRRADYRKSLINKILFTQHLGYGLEYFTDVRF